MFRAAIWTSDDGRSQVALTHENEAHLPDAALNARARRPSNRGPDFRSNGRPPSAGRDVDLLPDTANDAARIRGTVTIGDFLL